MVFRIYGLDVKNVFISFFYGLFGNYLDFLNFLDMKVNIIYGKVYWKFNELIVFEIKDGKFKNGEEVLVYLGDWEIYFMLS